MMIIFSSKNIFKSKTHLNPGHVGQNPEHIGSIFGSDEYI